MSPIISSGSGGGGGAMLQLFDSTLGGAAASIDTGAGGVAGSANHLLIVLLLRTTEAATTSFPLLRFNNDSAANYDQVSVTGAAAASSQQNAGNTGLVMNVPGASSARAAVFGASEVLVPAYVQTTAEKAASFITGHSDSTAANMQTQQISGSWRNTAAITRVQIVAAANNLAAGSRMTIYGLI